MNAFGLNIILAIAWVAFTGSVSLVGLITGFVIGYGALWLIQPLIGTSTYFNRVTAWIKLVIMFHYELIVSSLAVAFDILTPRHRARPAIIEVPLDVKSDTGILLVTNLISLTPGTLSLDVSEDRKTLLVHAMFADDHDALRKSLKNGMERWVIDAVEGT
ncbi:Na+/H+ antiporter subunit E [Marivita sp. XM-24bin2]|jgi:multicomponent Na+:H+ antiporter subunit E|uniref:Na+/H+ antiporter subunit E n=1 Tax=unclassified Marivita TaxID=2632480 RepID=UPI000D7B417D|nr:Na+/H+ antiporter subunit E [Marivita sp. XM-24bin2]MCR9107682.1 Na+/H+ antiporter subunit E [Paracoccaceae bacterium]PWL35514.1 MAG: sodium:proton antiporter [Marivita sp. XM-24bin2]